MGLNRVSPVNRVASRLVVSQAQVMEDRGIKLDQAALTHLIRGFAKERDVNAAMVSVASTASTPVGATSTIFSGCPRLSHPVDHSPSLLLQSG
jgi:hypothetical protein